MLRSFIQYCASVRPGACWQWANDANSTWIFRILIFAPTSELEFSVNLHHFWSLSLFFVPKNLVLAHGILSISKPQSRTTLTACIHASLAYGHAYTTASPWCMHVHDRTLREMTADRSAPVVGRAVAQNQIFHVQCTSQPALACSYATRSSRPMETRQMELISRVKVDGTESRRHAIMSPDAGP